MDIHPPHGAVGGWRDFLIHLSIVTLGILIALGLEAVVEWAHHKHLVHTAEANLSAELQANRRVLANDSKSLDAAEKQAEADLAVLFAFKTNKRPGSELRFYWEWNSPSSAAWDAARNTGATALMDYSTAQAYADIYSQQSLVTQQASVYIRDVYKSAVPLEGGRRLADLSPAEVEAMIASVQQGMVDLNLLRDLSESLSRLYARSPK